MTKYSPSVRFIHPLRTEEFFFGGSFYMPEGTVKWFNARKGYGFISMEDGDDIFCHYSDIEVDGFKTLNENQRVSFEIKEGPKGLQAIHIKPV